jgi:hypothetical protein
MTEPAGLNDEDLLERAHQLRLLALRDHVEARDPAQLHEREVRRRFGSSGASVNAALMAGNHRRRPLWRFW